MLRASHHPLEVNRPVEVPVVLVEVDRRQRVDTASTQDDRTPSLGRPFPPFPGALDATTGTPSSSPAPRHHPSRERRRTRRSRSVATRVVHVSQYLSIGIPQLRALGGAAAGAAGAAKTELVLLAIWSRTCRPAPFRGEHGLAFHMRCSDIAQLPCSARYDCETKKHAYEYQVCPSFKKGPVGNQLGTLVALSGYQ